jgi:hypothetical protein
MLRPAMYMLGETKNNRYLVRRGTRLWMIWDREKKGPAIVNDRQLVLMEEEAARLFCAMLNDVPSKENPPM